jgi:hypothetical protein
MAQTKTTIGSGTKIVGQLTSDEDLTVEGRVEGGPLRVRGRLTVAAGGAVSCEDTEVGDALVAGVFEGTLRARDAARIHTGGRILGEIIAARVMFVSDKQLAALMAAPANAHTPAAPVHTPAAPAHTPAAPAAPAPAPGAPAPESPGESASAAPAEPDPAAAASDPSARVIPSMPSLGQRAMQRKD